MTENKRLTFHHKLNGIVFILLYLKDNKCIAVNA